MTAFLSASVTPARAQATHPDYLPLCWYGAFGQGLKCYSSPEEVCKTWGPTYGDARVWYSETLDGGTPRIMCRGSGYSLPELGVFYFWPAAASCNIDGQAQSIAGYSVTWAGCFKKTQSNIFDGLQDKRCPAPSNGQPNASPVVGNPVVLASGDKVETVEDYASDGPNPLRFWRAYSFQNAYPDGLLGWGWSAPFDARLFASSSKATVILPGGQRFGFDVSGTTYTPTAAGRSDGLQKTGASTYRWTSGEGETFDFNLAADGVNFVLSSWKSLGGYGWSLSYDASNRLQSLTDTLGRTVGFTLTGGRITQATFAGGFTLNYVYEDLPGGTPTYGKRLISVKKSAPGATDATTTYLYENATFPTALTGVVDARGVRTATWTYGATSGRVVQSEHAGGSDMTTIAYDDTANTRTVTGPLGKQEIYHFGTVAGRLVFTSVDGLVSAHCPASSSAQTYSPSGFVATRTDEEGRTTAFTRDSTGKELTRTQAVGTPSARTATTTWDTRFPLPVQVVLPGLTADYVYNAQGLMTSRTLTDTTTFTAPYATNGRTRAWTYDWSPAGQLLGIDGPLAGTGDKLGFTYNSDGYLATATDELGKVTTISAWDRRGAPLTVVDPNGVSTNLTYDLDGRLLTATINPGAAQSVYQFVYDAVGNLTKLSLPKGGFLQYAYNDAGRLTSATNDRGQTQTFTHNNAGQQTSVTVKTAAADVTRQQALAYDELGRRISVVGVGGQTWAFNYDKVGNNTGVTDARNKATTTAFDALDRVISQTDPESKTVQAGYNAQDAVTSFKDGRALETTRVVDGFGDVIREVSPDRGTRTYWYDAAGRATKLVDGDGQETVWTYDNAGRRLTANPTGATAENVTYSYDAVAGGNKGRGRLTGVTEQSGTSAFVYDALGQLVTDTRTIKGASYAVGYTYDANGDVTKITYPSGRQVLLFRANDGLATTVKTVAPGVILQNNVLANITYAPFGPLTSGTFGNGLVLTRGYDQNQWLSRLEVKVTGTNRMDVSLARNANGALAGVTDNLAGGRNAAYNYTDAGRLQTATGAWGDETYSYDGAGNRTGKRRDDAGVISYEFAINSGANNRVTQVQNTTGAPIRNLSYRNGGDLEGQQFVGGSTFIYGYNARKRLASVMKDSVTTATYGYDFQGRRVWRNIPGAGVVETHYVFDTAGHVLAEYNAATGAVIKEYIWLDDMPLAMIDSSTGTATTYYIHTGPTGEPQMMTNATRGKVWDVAVDPWGKVSPLSTGTKDLAMRLPGQWLQAEMADLHQNQWRHYDPSLGRYIETDPLGLEAGQNVYAYVDGRPLESVDTDGLDIIYLSSPNAVLGAGHGAALVGSEAYGWWLYSKNGNGEGNYHREYFETKELARSSTLLDRYTRSVRIPTSRLDDLKMILVGQVEVGAKYDFARANCADLVLELMRVGDVGLERENSVKGLGITVPNFLYDKLVGLYGAYNF